MWTPMIIRRRRWCCGPQRRIRYGVSALVLWFVVLAIRLNQVSTLTIQLVRTTTTTTTTTTSSVVTTSSQKQQRRRRRRSYLDNPLRPCCCRVSAKNRHHDDDDYDDYDTNDTTKNDNDIMEHFDNADDNADANADDNDDNDSEMLFLERFKRRKRQVDSVVKEEVQRRPPNPQLTPTQVVEELLHGLLGRHVHTPIQHFGITTLLRASSPSWRKVLFQSVGAPTTTTTTNANAKTSMRFLNENDNFNNHDNDNLVALALEAAMGRPNNQFRILLGKEDPYSITFPTDHVDYMDGTGWIECQLRSIENDELLVVMGWSLVKLNITHDNDNNNDDDTEEAAWFIDGMDWQDFRDAYRPGIGREEWERICG